MTNAKNQKAALALADQMTSKDLEQDISTLHYEEIPLHLASIKGYKDLVQKLIETKPSMLSSKDNGGYNILMLAAGSGNTELVQYLMSFNKIDVSTKNDVGFNILHIASFLGHAAVIKTILDKYKNKDLILSKIMNERDNDGNNPLGMAFLGENHVPQNDLIKVIKLFILQENFKINAYLNNKQGMDSLAPYDEACLKIGGFNILHMALLKNLPDILRFLAIRNDHFGWKVDSEKYCNFMYPALNPKYHMWSPIKLVSSIAKDTDDISILLVTHQRSQMTIQEEDESGDSDVESSSAYIWKKVLVEMANNTGIHPDNNKHATPLFHGMPFIAGLYSHEDRKYIGESMMLLNPGLSDEVKSEIKDQLIGIASKKDSTLGKQLLQISIDDEDHKNERSKELIKPDARLKAIHSRTSTANVGMESVSMIVKAGVDGAVLLDVQDTDLKQKLGTAYSTNPQNFKKQIVNFVNRYADTNGATQQDVWNGLIKLNNALNQDIVKYRFPFISTSKTPWHAYKFGFGIGLEDDRGEGKMEPHYNYDPHCLGKPKHRLAGFMYIIKEEGLVDDVASGNVFDVCSLPKVKPRYKNQAEVVYLGGIDKDKVIAIIPLVYPNFSKEFKESYHKDVLGFEPDSYARAQRVFKELPRHEEMLSLTYTTKTNTGNPNALGACLANIFLHFSEKVASKFFGTQLCTILNQEVIIYDKTPYTVAAGENYTSPVHKMLIESKAKGTPSPTKVVPKSHVPDLSQPLPKFGDLTLSDDQDDASRLSGENSSEESE